VPRKIYIDFETRSTADLPVVGLWNYSTHPMTDVWCMSYAFDDEEPRTWLPGAPLPVYVKEHVNAGGIVVAHNAEFELAIWNNICVNRFGWPLLRHTQVRCTMAACYAMSLPGALEDAALALGIDMKKDMDGRALMRKMARPRSKPGQPLEWWDDPSRLLALYRYCRQDVRVEREIHKRVMPLGESEQKVWEATCEINQKGIPFDVESVVGASQLVDKVEEHIDAQLSKLTEGAVASATALIPMKGWLSEQLGQPITDLTKQAVVDLLTKVSMPQKARDVLVLRQEAGKASTAKLSAILDRMDSAGIVRNAYVYHGAGTGRWSGRGVQPHNMPRDVPSAVQVEDVLRLVRLGEYRMISLLYGPPLTTVSHCLRPMIQVPEGHVLVGGDWSNVEGRGAAWFAGEDWKLDVFRKADRGEGPGVYEVTAASICGVPAEQVNKRQRQAESQVPELAFQYGGGVGAFQVMSKAFGVHLSNEKVEEFKQAWRMKHPRIVETWRNLSDAAIAATRNEGLSFNAGAAGRRAAYKRVGSFLWCLLPSGRVICYPYPKVLQGLYGPQLTYMANPGVDKAGIFADPANAPNWARVGAHGGLLFENIVQGFCSDFLRDAILACRAKQYSVVVHTHDDLFCEVPLKKVDEALLVIERIMNTPPAWAVDFPLVAKVHYSRRYGVT